MDVLPRNSAVPEAHMRYLTDRIVVLWASEVHTNHLLAPFQYQLIVSPMFDQLVSGLRV